jgi:hypothetical protein
MPGLAATPNAGQKQPRAIFSAASHVIQIRNDEIIAFRMVENMKHMQVVVFISFYS